MSRGSRSVVTMAALVGVAMLVVSTPVTAAARVDARLVAGDLDAPVAFTFAPDGTLWYVEKASGQIRTRDLATDEDALFFTVPGVDAEGERGLLGIALHPRYPDRPYVYVYATRSVDDRLRNQIVRLTDDGGSGAELRVVLSTPAASSPYHNGGRIAFGPDGMLYAIVGDGHDPSNAQDLTSNDRGKILRMKPGGGVPRSNPFDGRRIWAYGIRNSFGFAFDPQTNRLWESENGPSCNDELNFVRRGRNYGWGPNQTCEGSSPANTNQDGPRPVFPELWYTPPIAPTGVAFCDGCGLGARSEGALFFGAVNTGDLRRVLLTDSRRGVRGQVVVYTHGSGILSVEPGPGGRLYFSDFTGIYRLVRR